MIEQEKPESVNMLLDTEHFYGESHRRLAPIIITLCVAGAPLLLYAGVLIAIVPFWIFAILEVIWAVRWVMLILGEENKRLAAYKRRCFDAYAPMYALLNVKYIHKDGLIEYMDGRVKYLVICENGNRVDDIARAQMVRQLLITLTSVFSLDVHIQNFDVGEVLAMRYNNLKLFKDKAAMRDCLSLLMKNIELANTESFLTRTIFAVKGRRNEFKRMKQTIEKAISSEDARAFKSIRLATEEEAKSIISEDLDSNIDYEAMLTNKYNDENYYTNRVISYDKDLDFSEDIKEDYEEGEGFIIE